MLLAGGHTDAGAGRSAPDQPRSVTTIVRGLMDRFSVDNRFQLGLALDATRRIPGTGKADGAPDDPWWPTLARTVDEAQCARNRVTPELKRGQVVDSFLFLGFQVRP